MLIKVDISAKAAPLGTSWATQVQLVKLPRDTCRGVLQVPDATGKV